MAEIRKKAIEYSRKKYKAFALDMEKNIDGTILAGLANAFTDGAYFAHRWISVEEELPEHSMRTATDGAYAYTLNPVIVKTSSNRCRILKRCRLSAGDWEWLNSETSDEYITHWRYIELE